MSVAHHRVYRHRPQTIAETYAALFDKKVKAYLLRPFKVNTSYHIAYTGGSSLDGRTYYLDKDLPDRFYATVLWHERVEKAIRDVLKRGYSRAHELATCAERLLVERMGMNWSAYKRDVGKYVEANLKQPMKSVPKNFDIWPYKESGDMKLLGGQKP